MEVVNEKHENFISLSKEMNMLKKRIFGIMTSILAAMLIFSFTACTGDGGSSKNYADVTKVESLLAIQKGGSSSDDLISINIKINLQNMASRENNWQKLLTSINTAGLYVPLDLSGSTMPTTEFNVDGSTETGKQFIMSLISPGSTGQNLREVQRPP